MSLWTPCPECGHPLKAKDHDNGCPNKRMTTMNDDHDNRQTDDDMLRKLSEPALPDYLRDETASIDDARARAASITPRGIPLDADAVLDKALPHIVHLSKAGVHVDGMNISETIVPPLSTPRLFTTRPEVVEAMQWNGEGDLAAFQAWLWPLSPMYRPPSGGYEDVKPTIKLQVFDPQKEVMYPTLPPYADVTVHPGSWVVKLADGKFVTMTNDVMQQRFEAVQDPVAADAALDAAVPPPAPMAAKSYVDEDPTTVVDTSAIRATHPRAIEAEAKRPGDVDDRIDL